MKLFFLTISLFMSSTHANELNCKAWFQPKNSAYIQKDLKFIELDPIGRKRYELEIENVVYRVFRDFDRKSLDASIIISNTGSHVYGTLIEPNENNYATLDMTRENGDRLSIDCSINL